MMAVTALCAAAATEVSAQSGSLVLNNQLQLGDVISGQTLNVEGAMDRAQGQVTVWNTASGNTLVGSVENDGIELRSDQRVRGNVTAETELNLGSGDTTGEVNAGTIARGNYIGGRAYDADMVVDANQTVEGGEIVARSNLPGGSARLMAGGTIGAGAAANDTAISGAKTSITGQINQTSDASVRAYNLVEVRYIPAGMSVEAEALGNRVGVNGEAQAHTDLAIRQRSTGDIVHADVSANAGNAWDLAGRANAAANQAILSNKGGSMLVQTDQNNSSQVRSDARVTSYDYGAATVHAQGVGNMAQAGNDDRYIKIDNAQVNTGGVDVSASFVGAKGYDAYVSADAAGNSVTGYACSSCQGTLNATNNQTNSGNVSASANTIINGSGRAVVSSSNAVGNAATFFVSKPGS